MRIKAWRSGSLVFQKGETRSGEERERELVFFSFFPPKFDVFFSLSPLCSLTTYSPCFKPPASPFFYLF